MPFSKKLRKTRKLKGLTQLDLARAINVDRTVISKYERNVSLPNVEMLCLICRALQVTPNDLLL